MNVIFVTNIVFSPRCYIFYHVSICFHHVAIFFYHVAIFFYMVLHFFTWYYIFNKSYNTISVNVGYSLRKTVLFENTGYKIAWWSYINLSIILKIKIWNELSVPPNVCQNWNSFCFIKLYWTQIPIYKFILYTFVSKILLYYIS